METKYEYRVITERVDGPTVSVLSTRETLARFGENITAKISKLTAKLEDEGWEYVTFTPLPSDYRLYAFTFRRALR